MTLTTKDDIKTNDDLNIYGWDMRIVEVDETIAILKKNRNRMVSIRNGIKRRHNKGVAK